MMATAAEEEKSLNLKLSRERERKKLQFEWIFLCIYTQNFRLQIQSLNEFKGPFWEFRNHEKFRT
jgi:hypothetical protein